MPAVWSSAKWITFWAQRKWQVIRKDNNTDARIARLNADIAAKNTCDTEATKSFLQRYSGKQCLTQSSYKFNSRDAIAWELWIILSSWTYCKSCKQLLPRKMIQTFLNKTIVKTNNLCTWINYEKTALQILFFTL